MRGERPLFAGVALGTLWATRRCSGLKRLLICAAVLGPWLFALPLARAHDTDYDAYRPARSHHRRIEDHHRDVKDAWNEHVVAPFEDFANDVAALFTNLCLQRAHLGHQLLHLAGSGWRQGRAGLLRGLRLRLRFGLS